MIDRSKIARNCFYRLLDILILRQWYIKDHIKVLFNKNDNFVFYDAGAGFCQYTDFILKHYKQSKIVAMDLKSDYLSSYERSLNTEQLSRIDIFEGDLQTFVSPIKADLVIAIDILEHIENDRAVLANFYQGMKSGGILIISTPSNLDEAAAFTAEHVRPGYSKDELEDKVSRAGFKILTLYYSYGKYGKTYWLLGMKIPLKLLALSRLFLLLLPIYFFFIIPLNLVFMTLDTVNYNKKGNGIICIVQK